MTDYFINRPAGGLEMCSSDQLLTVIINRPAGGLEIRAAIVEPLYAINRPAGGLGNGGRSSTTNNLYR